MRLAMRRFWLAAALSASAVAAGCGDDDEGTSGIPLSDLPAAYADVVCNTTVSCYGVLGEVIIDAQTCEPEITKELEDMLVPQLKGYIAAGTVVYHEDKVQACLDAIKDAGCSILDSRSPSACEDALEGKVARGGDCNSTIECVGDDFCEFTTSSCPGQCAAPRPEGASCTLEGDECQTGLACQTGAAQGDLKCRTPAKVGEPCKGNSAPDCQGGALCVGNDPIAGTSGTCKLYQDVATRGQGESCDPDEGAYCQEGLSCVIDMTGAATTWKCVAPSSSGGTCKLGVPDPCPSDEYCDADFLNGVVDGICHKLPTDGQPCKDEAFGLGPRCTAGHECDGTNTCRAKQRIGATCVEDDVCYSDTCEGGKCAAPTCDAPTTP